jgi:polyhydroxyalkanoate synthesis regulator phasin
MTNGGSKERRGARRRMSDGIKEGIGVLSAFKEAIEETIQEARKRGDLSPDGAKRVMKDALGKAQSAASGARERLDFAHQRELDALADSVSALRTRVAALEERVFGPSGGASEGSASPGGSTGGGASAP